MLNGGSSMNKEYHKKTFEKIPVEKQDRIIKAAITEFARNGYNGANINVIAENTDISVGSLYKYFSSKENLFLSLLNRGYKLLESVISEADFTGNDTFTKIENLLRAAHKYAVLYPEWNHIYLDLATEGLSHFRRSSPRPWRPSRRISTAQSSPARKKRGSSPGTWMNAWRPSAWTT